MNKIQGSFLNNHCPGKIIRIFFTMKYFTPILKSCYYTKNHTHTKTKYIKLWKNHLKKYLKFGKNRTHTKTKYIKLWKNHFKKYLKFGKNRTHTKTKYIKLRKKSKKMKVFTSIIKPSNKIITNFKKINERFYTHTKSK